MAIDTTCSKCYEAKVPACAVNYLLGGFAPNVDYHVIATDRFGNKYEVDEDKPSDPDGNVSIIFPEGLAEAGSGVLKLEVFRAEDLSVDGAFCRPQAFTTCDQSYSCLNVSFYNLDRVGTIENWKINCPCNELCYDCGADKTIIGMSNNIYAEGWYIAEYANTILYFNESNQVYNAVQCSEVAPVKFYEERNGPYIFDTNESKWLPVFEYSVVGAEPNVSVSFTGTINRYLSDDCTFILQISIDGGATVLNHAGPYNYQELQSGITASLTYPSYRSRLKITTPSGCVYYSVWETLTEA